jgi:hypothetical protein
MRQKRNSLRTDNIKLGTYLSANNQVTDNLQYGFMTSAARFYDYLAESLIQKDILLCIMKD